MQSILNLAERLTDAELLRRVEVLAGRERQGTVELIGHLAELDKRKIYRGEGYASLFRYCTTALRLSEQAAYKRIVAARASRRFPVVLERLASGSLNLSTLGLLAPILTDENHQSLLTQAGGKTKREVELLVARIVPKPEAPASIRRLPTSAAMLERCAVGPTGIEARAPGTSDNAIPRDEVAGSSGPGLSEGDRCDEPGILAREARSSAPPVTRPEIVPLTPERFRIQFTVSRETESKLRRAQDLLRREIPDGDPAAIFERALTLLLEDVARKKLAATTRPRPGSVLVDGRSRHVAAALKRKVWLRDGGRCAFVAKSGRRCIERALLEFHHVEPHAIGGATTLANLSLRCRSHNAYEAEMVFGAFEPMTRQRRGS
jgi:hypothetical protein